MRDAAIDPGEPAHTAAGRADRAPREGRDARVVDRLELAGVWLGSSLTAGAAMAATLMAIGEISSEPTAVPGIDSSTWTPITAISSFLFGIDAFHGDFHVLSILFGLGAHGAFSLLFGALGVGFLLVSQGPRPGRAGAALLGLAYGLFVEVIFLNLVVNAIQEVHTVYESIPQWGWWVAHAVYGSVLGLTASLLFGRPAGG